MSTNWAALREKFRTEKRCEESSCRDRSDTTALDDDEVEPPDRAEIGRAAWRYLHSMAAEHPAEASEAISQQAQAWLAAFVQNYPCSHCATHFLDVCEAMPPQTKSREDYAVPLPDLPMHNKVNEALMNQTIPCDPKQLIAAGQLGLTIDERSAE
ncbi:ERV2 [Symbiodinium sp. CCMP2456]|nr:ERV2 [Symbiodinium sp. CCMP2456]